MKRIILLLALALSLTGGAQTLQDYDVSIENDTWQSIASTGTRLAQVYYDNNWQQIQLPFDLEFGLNTFYQGQNIKVTGRGTLIFGNYGPWSYAYTHWNDPSQEYVVIPFFMGQAQCPNRYNSQVYWLTRPDDRGGQELVVEWDNIYRNPNIGENVAYQVHVHSNGDIGVVYGPCTLSTQEDTLFTFAMVGGSTADRVLITGNWNTSSSITKANPSSVSRYPLTPLMGGTPSQGLRITYLRPLPPCPHPTHLMVSGVQQEVGTISWTGNGVSGGQYKLQYDTVSFTPGTTTQGMLTVSDTFCTLTNLLPGSHYYVYVRSDCGADTSNWEGVDFWTSCNEMTHADLPYEQHFESVESVAECWRKLGHLYWSTQQSATVRFCSMMYDTTYAIMPPIDYVNDLQVSFRVKSGPVMVGVMDSPSDTASFVPLQECWANNADWYSYTVRLSRYSGNGKYITFRPWPNQYGMASCYLDDVVLDTIQGCIAPVNVTAARVNAVSADIRWRDYDSVGLYRVTWQGNGQPANTLTVTTDHCLLTGLTPELEYIVTVAIICDSSTTGPEDTVRFTTLPTCMTPVAIDADVVSGRRATVHWTEMNTIGTYLVLLTRSFGSDTVSRDTVVGDTTITYYNLEPHSQYYVDVRQLCSGTWTDEQWTTFHTEYSCSGPQGVSIDSVGTTSATITIADSLGAASYMVIVTAGAWRDTLYTSDTVLTLTGLNTATSYTVIVSAQCADTTLSDTVRTSFSTPCSIITHADIPYIETFDNCSNGDAGSLSPCWTFNSFAPSNYVGIYRPASNIYHGTSGLSLYTMVRSSTEPVFVTLPEVDNFNDLVINFWVYCTWEGDATVDIGVMADPNDTTTFTALQRYIPAIRYQWFEVEVPFDGYSGSGRYAALRAGTLSTTMGDPLYFDDVTLKFNLSCRQPDSLIVDNLTATSADLTIVPAAVADSDAVAYRVVLSSHYGTDTFQLSTLYTTFNSLIPATDYEVEVRSECPEGGLTTAAYTQFTTPCGAYQLPYFDDFEYQSDYQLPRCWELMDSGSISPMVRSTWVTPYSGSRVLAVSVTDSAYSSFATPWVQPNASPVILSFMVRAFSYRYNVDTTPVAFQVELQNADTMVTLFSGKVLYADWTQLDLTAARGLLASGGRFVFTLMQEIGDSNRTGMLNIDDISVVAACLPVEGLEVVTADTVPTSLTAHWTPMGIETGWEVIIWNTTFFYNEIVRDPWLVLTNIGMLLDSTDYWLAVRPICGVGDTGEWSDTVFFRTPDPYNPGGINSSLSATHSQITIYPNPASDRVTLELYGTQGTATVELLDASGRSCGKWIMTGGRLAIDTNHFSSGVYMIRVVSRQGTFVRKLIVRR